MPSLITRLRTLAFRGRLDRELDEEMESHLDRLVARFRNDGWDEAEARRRALIEFGTLFPLREEARDARGVRLIEDLGLDVRHSARALIRSRGFTIGAGAVLALAIGASTAIFSVVNTVLLQPLPYPDSESIVSVETFFSNTGQSSPMVSGPDFLDWQAQSDVFETMAVYSGGDDIATVVGGQALFSNALFVSAGFFEVFGQSASVGRLLVEDDVQAGGVAVVAYPWAVTHFGSAEAAIGATFLLYGGPLEIVGVAAPGFDYPGEADLWVPFNVEPPPGVPAAAIAAQRVNYAYQAVGRIAPNVGFTRAEATMRTIGDRLAREYAENRLKTVTLTPLRERITGNIRVTLWILMSAVGVVWLIACANIANILLARGAGRAREIALRAALGAGRGRVLRQLLTESGVLAGAAGLAGLILASLLIRGVVAFSPADLPRIGDVRIDATVLGFGFALSLVSTAIFGLVPALQASRLDLSDALKRGSSKTTASRSSAELRSALVVAEVALSVVLLASAGLLARSFQALQHVDLGFTADRVVAAFTEYAVEDSDGIPNRIGFFNDVLDRLRAVPGVESAAGAAYLGMGWEPRVSRDVFIGGQPEGPSGERPQAEVYDITGDYFATLEIPILDGRDFTRSDTPESAGVAIINESLARVVFPGQSPLGRRISINPMTPDRPGLEIIGVVGNTRWQDPSQPAPPMMFRAVTQGTGNSPSVLVRTSLDDAAIATTLRRVLNDADSTVPVEIETMNAMFDSTLRYPRFRTQVIGLFAALATALSAVGIFSLLAYLIRLRARELALRQALGARRTDVVRLVVGQGLRLIGIGLLLGLAGALGASRLLTGLLFEIGPGDIATYMGTIVVLGGVGLISIFIPALRAATAAPLSVLQGE